MSNRTKVAKATVVRSAQSLAPPGEISAMDSLLGTLEGQIDTMRNNINIVEGAGNRLFPDGNPDGTGLTEGKPTCHLQRLESFITAFQHQNKRLEEQAAKLSKLV